MTKKVRLRATDLHDKRLSKNRTQSCAKLSSAGASRSRTALPRGRVEDRRTAAQSSLRERRLYRHALVGEPAPRQSLSARRQIPSSADPVEFRGRPRRPISRRASSPSRSTSSLSRAFPESGGSHHLANLLKALASFRERTIVSGPERLDRWSRDGDQSAMSDAAKRICAFHAEKFECFSPPHRSALSDHATLGREAFNGPPLSQYGLYNVDVRRLSRSQYGVEGGHEAAGGHGPLGAASLPNVAPDRAVHA